MCVRITGNIGSVRPMLVRHLRRSLPGAELIGYDTEFFAHCLTGAETLPERCLDRQNFGDIRELSAALLAGVDAVVHLAAISHDPMGEAVRIRDRGGQCGWQPAAGRCGAGGGRAEFLVRIVMFDPWVRRGRAAAGRRSGQSADRHARSKVSTKRGLHDMNQGGMTITRLPPACASPPPAP